MNEVDREESGSYGSSVVGQATELPLESDFYFLLNKRVVSLFRELIRSFSPRSIFATKREIQSWIDALNRLDKVVLHADPLLDLRLVPEQPLKIYQLQRAEVVRAPVEKLEGPNFSAFWRAGLFLISTIPQQKPAITEVAEPKQPLAGEIWLGEQPFQEELAIIEAPEKIYRGQAHSPLHQLFIELDVALWWLRTKSYLKYKVFALNPQPVYAKARRYTGNGFIGIAIFTMVFFGAPFLALELRAMVFRITAPLVSQAEPQAQPVVNTSAQVVNPDPDKQFQIEIPEIGVDAKVIANVDANNPAEYDEALMHGVAHAKGTGLPGDDGGTDKTIFIFSHSTNATWNITRFNALFYSLKDLKPEDQIQIWFWGKEYWYKVVDTKIVAPDDTAFLKPQMDQEKLVLQTCWPPGTTQKRLIVTADRVYEGTK